MNRREAILLGVGAANELHEQLGLRERLASGAQPIDIYDVIASLGLTLFFKPLDTLLGIYIPGRSPGILITTQRSIQLQRFTAAHELGHYVLQHRAPSLDFEVGFLARGSFGDDGQELAADTFAAEFLLPSWLLRAHIRKQGWGKSDLANPCIVYQLALRLGLSYEATCWSLLDKNLLPRHTVEKLRGVPPKKSKEEVLHDISPPDWRLDVWQLTAADDKQSVLGSIRDYLVITLTEHTNGGYCWDIGSATASGFEILADERITPAESGYGSTVLRRAVMRGSRPHAFLKLEEKRTWSDAPPLSNLTCELSLRGAEFQGGYRFIPPASDSDLS